MQLQRDSVVITYICIQFVFLLDLVRTEQCAHGTVQLVDGQVESEGIIEVCYDGEWGTVCDENFQMTDGRVVCRQLGYPDYIVEVFNSAADFSKGGSGDFDTAAFYNVNCTGTEDSLFNCSKLVGSNFDCESTIGIKCSNISAAVKCSEKSVRLVNGTSSTEGRIEVCVNGQWGTVCDDYFELPDGFVVCKQLGFIGVTQVLNKAAFGEGNGPIWLDDIACTGNETTIFDCTSMDHDCGHHEDVGVICFNQVECNDGSIRLVDGSNITEGRVEVCYSGQWGTVCDDEFELVDGLVACRQLNFSGIAGVSKIGGGTGPILLDNVGCVGNEENLLDCTNSGILHNNCDHEEDVGVICSILTECIDSSVRLVNGLNTVEGRVEICYKGKWGTVCNDNFGLVDGFVVCRQLGFSGITQVVNAKSLFGEGTGLIWLDEVSCVGDERSLLDCASTLSDGIIHDCGHSEDIGVTCSNSSIAACSIEQSVQLVDGMSKAEGRVEVCYNGQWGTVCDHKFGFNEGHVVCRQLGFDGVENVETAQIAEYGEGTGIIWLNEVQCTGNETTIFDCTGTLAAYMDHDCSHHEDVGVRCMIDPVSSTTSTSNSIPSQPSTSSSNSISSQPSTSSSNSIPSQPSTSSSNSIPSQPSTSSFNSVPSQPLNNFVIAVVSGTVVSSAIIVLIVVTIFFLIVLFKISRKRNRSFGLRMDNDFQLSSFQGIDAKPADYLEYRCSGDENQYTPIIHRKLSEMLKPSLINPSNLEILEEVGEGEFGVVYRGILKSQLENEAVNVSSVALKTLKGSYSDSQFDQMIKEAEKMKAFDHLHVLPLVGICIGLLESPACLVMPFMSNGSLLSYLRRESPKFSLPDFAEETLFLEKTKKLLSMCLQVAKGMEYLSEQKFVHRDLAARNCMISADGIIKVADFGLAEDIYTNEYFKMSKDSSEPIKLPIKWLALESIHYGRFDEKTDVWSFGVLCWEVFSIGRIPYPGINHKELVHMLDAGERLKKPSNPTCTPEIYTALMMSCWDQLPDARPCFSDLVAEIEMLLAPMAEYECMDFEDGINYNT